MRTLDKKEQFTIAMHLRERLKCLKIKEVDKRGFPTKKALKVESEFLHGVQGACLALGVKMPPIFFICGMTGRSITQEVKSA